MKKLFAILLVAALLIPMATVAFAANTTTLTTTVPAATYTLNIPADQKIEFGTTSAKLGELTVTNASGFASEKNLSVTVTYTDFTCADVSTTIPFTLFAKNASRTIYSGDAVVFNGKSDGTLDAEFHITNTSKDSELIFQANSANWSKALAGDYSATITFTAEVVAG